MKAIYNHEEVDLLPTGEEWRTKSALTGKLRSGKLKELDNALDLLDKNPTLSLFDQVNNKFTVWSNTKRTPNGAFDKTKRRDAANELNEQIRRLGEIRRDRTQLMQRVQTLIDHHLPWRSRCLCAELYDTKDRRDWGVLKDHVKWLEDESSGSSGWSKLPSTTIDGWSDKGEEEIRAVNQWPQLGFKTRVLLASRMGVDQISITVPWMATNGALHVRKGLYCHSSAAIVAHLIHQNRNALQNGLQCPIRSIGLIHQRSNETLAMTHWWVCINLPDELRLGNNRVVRFSRTSEYNYLPLLGGFIIDIWGALWLKQCENGNTWATSPVEIQEPCVEDSPFIVIKRSDETARIFVKHVY